ncbi:MAG: fibronectin type III domain-containing protein [Candidatus Diapherotrites archaeon]
MRKAPIFVFLILLFAGAFAIDAPVVSSSKYPVQGDWYSDAYAQFSWEQGDATSFSYVYDTNPDTIPDNVAETTEPTASLPPKIDGDWYFHIRAKKGSEISDTTTYHIKLDITKPSPPTKVKVEPTAEGYLRVTWNEATDIHSGVASYKIYRSFLTNFDVRDTTTLVVAMTQEGTSFVDEDVLENRVYHYKVQSRDVAGNLGSIGAEAVGRTLGFCDITISIDMAITDGEKLEIEVESTNGDMRYASMALILPDGTENILVERQIQTTTMSKEFDLSQTDEGLLRVRVNSEDSAGDDCLGEEELYFDTINPSIEILTPTGTEKITEMVKVEATATDTGTGASGIEKVVFYRKEGEEWVEIGEGVGEGDSYVFDWNSFNAPNGRYLFKAEVIDRAGNIGDEEFLINVENTAFIRAQAETAISAAEYGKASANEFVAQLANQNIDSNNLMEFLSWADSNLMKAQDLYDKGFYFERAKEHAETATKMFLQAKEKVNAESYKTVKNVFGDEQLVQVLNSAGLQKHLLEDSAAMIKRFGAERKMRILKVTDFDETYYLANIIISIKNNDKDELNLKLIEIIPKGVAENTGAIETNFPFDVLKEDPIIVFSPETILYGKQMEINYGFGGVMDKAAADDLIAQELAGKYSSPPILLDSSVEVTPSTISVPLFDIDISGILSGVDIGIILIVAVVIIIFVLIVVVIVVALIIGVFFFLKSKRNSRQKDLKDFLR